MSENVEPILRARGVCFSWGHHEVLKGVDLDVSPGSVVCLMGMNGCGKSTFLDCVLGENHLHQGTLHVAGHDVQDMRPKERARLLSYVPQHHERTFPYEVEHMVSMGRAAYASEFGSLDDDDKTAVEAAMRDCGIERLRNRCCTELSGGEMQMVALARALAQDAPLIVLDEPTAHLDSRNELVFLESLVRLVGQRSATVLMATHALNQAFHLQAAGLDVRVALMQDGRIAALGAPEEVFTEQRLGACFGVEAFVAQARITAQEVLVRYVVPVRSLQG